MLRGWEEENSRDRAQSLKHYLPAGLAVPAALTRATKQRGNRAALAGIISCSTAAASHAGGKAEDCKVERENELCCWSAALLGSRMCSLYACLPCLCLLSHLVFHDISLTVFDHCYWCEILYVIKLPAKLPLSFAQLDLVTKNTLWITALMSKVDRCETKIDYGNTCGMILIITVNYFKIWFPPSIQKITIPALD